MQFVAHMRPWPYFNFSHSILDLTNQQGIANQTKPTVNGVH